jgi:Cytochrome P450
MPGWTATQVTCTLLRMKELDSAGLLATAANPHPPTPTADDIRGLKFLDAVFHESMRVLPPVPNGTMRDLDHDIDVAGITLPKGTTVMIAPWAMHHSTAVWGADAKEWRPARWLEGRSVNAVKRDASGALQWLPSATARRTASASTLQPCAHRSPCLAVCMLSLPFDRTTQSSLRIHEWCKFASPKHHATGFH